MKFAVIGRDRRSVLLCRSLAGDGHRVHSFALEHAELPPEIPWLREGTFYQCTGLARVKLPEHLAATSSQGLLRDLMDGGLAYDGLGVFQGCRSLTEVVIPAGVQRIGFGTFRDCPGVKLVFEDGFAGEVEAGSGVC